MYYLPYFQIRILEIVRSNSMSYITKFVSIKVLLFSQKKTASKKVELLV
jgi:hypothetical protein